MSRRRLQRGLAADGVTHFAPIDRRRFETAKRLVSEDGVTSPDVAAAPDALLRSTHGGRTTKDLLSVAQEPQRLGMPQSYARSGPLSAWAEFFVRWHQMRRTRRTQPRYSLSIPL